MAVAGAALRGTLGSIAAAVVTIALFVLMYSLIAFQQPSLNEAKQQRIQDITMPKMEIETNLAQAKPEKPETPEKPPPEMQRPQQKDFDVKPSLDMSYQPSAKVSLGSGGLAVSDGEYLPLVKVAPMYPARAATRGIEGYCIVEYTVTKSGATKDVHPTDCQPPGIFEDASVRAAKKFKYKPKVIDGQPIAVAGVRNKFTYKLEK